MTLVAASMLIFILTMIKCDVLNMIVSLKIYYGFTKREVILAILSFHLPLKPESFQSINAVVFSYTLLCVAALASLLPFQLVLMQGLPIQECGPFTGVQSFSQIFHLVSELDRS